MRDRNRLLVGCFIASLLASVACQQPRDVPCDVGGVLGMPEFMLKRLRPAAVADLGVWEERLECDIFDRALYTMGQRGVVAITLVTTSGGANDKPLPSQIVRKMIDAWGSPDKVGVQDNDEVGPPAVVLEWLWEDDRTLAALRVPSTVTTSGECLLVVQIAEVKPPFDTLGASCGSAVALMPELRQLGIDCPIVGPVNRRD